MFAAVLVGVPNDHLFGKELFIRYTMRVFRDRLSVFISVCTFPFACEGGMWDLFVLIPDHFLSINFAHIFM